MENIFEELNNDERVNIKLSAEETSEFIEFIYEITQNDRQRTVTIRIGNINDGAAIQFLVPTEDDLICVGKCGMVLAGPLIECWRGWKGDFKNIIKCLQNKRFDILPEIGECVRDCY